VQAAPALPVVVHADPEPVVGQVTVPHSAEPAHVTSQRHALLHVILPHAAVPLQPTWQAAALHVTLPHAWVPSHVTSHGP
jgi:hypothetical protein